VSFHLALLHFELFGLAGQCLGSGLDFRGALTHAGLIAAKRLFHSGEPRLPFEQLLLE
jgi:hypothetical protein